MRVTGDRFRKWAHKNLGSERIEKRIKKINDGKIRGQAKHGESLATVAPPCRLMSRYLLPDLYLYVFPPLFRSLAAINSLEIKSVIFETLIFSIPRLFIIL